MNGWNGYYLAPGADVPERVSKVNFDDVELAKQECQRFAARSA
jgi:hypothetical protein